MSGIPASSHGGASLPPQWTTTDGYLTIAPTVADPTSLLELDAPSGYGLQDALTVRPDHANPALVKVVVGTDANAEIALTSQAGLREAKITMADNLHNGEIDLSTNNGVGIFPGGAGNFFYGLYVSPNQIPGAATVRLDAVATQTVPILNVSGNLVSSGVNADGNPFSRTGAAGALATTAFVSGTAKQVDTAADRFLCVPFTGDATNNAATLKIELSPDNVTFSILDTLSIAAALNLTGAINVPVTLFVPTAWYVKLTATHGTIGTATYY